MNTADSVQITRHSSSMAGTARCLEAVEKARPSSPALHAVCSDARYPGALSATARI